MTTTTNCKNQYLESDGYCTECGQNHFKMQSKRGNPGRAVKVTNQREMLKSEKIAKIQMVINTTPEYRTVKETLQTLAEIYGVKVNVVFRNRLSGYATNNADGSYTVVIGYQLIDEFAREGFRDYRADFVIGNLPRKNENASKWVACHEFAHILQIEANEIHRGDIHNSAWVRHYEEVRDLVF